MKVYVKGSLTVEELAKMCGGKIVGSTDKKITAITTDSRDICSGALFVAIKGEHFDGNNYLNAAHESGAVCSLAERVPDGFSGCAIVCESTKIALGKIAKAYKDRISPLTVAVTGSVGKTTTKEFIYAVLSEKYKTLKTEGNFNSDIGLPMTLLGLSEDDSAAILEMGMSAKGEIEYLSKIASPRIAVITNIGTSHIGLLGSREAIRDAKLEIREGLFKDGTLILNGDEPLLAGIDGATYVSFENEDADYYISGIVEGENGTAFDLSTKGNKYESVLIPTVGEHNVLNAAYAFAVGSAAGLGEFEIRRGLLKYKSADMRQQIYNKGGKVILEDCYNASPESMIAAIKVLSGIASRKGGRKVAVLGDMRELGSYSREEHRKVGAAVAAYSIDLLFTIGKDAKEIAESALYFGLEKENVYVFEDIDDVERIGKAIADVTGPSDVILFKASRAVALERVAKYITG
ncbi:MAG: UDP-N-acetylmuramoyl-tripeptide--D-alanyl-D-alanine ligase [Clostridia bacterium]|nr:UDP-N-acetylmuramoyl-tripeptide--D-alanyl-D-alanine ligase [Clostridia bacterium]